MARYISFEKVPITEGADTIYIRSKMNFEQREQAEDAIRQISVDTTGAGLGSAELKAGAYRIALLRINVVGWEGPGFEGLRYSPENIGKLDPDDPLIERVMEQIALRNPPSWKAREGSADQPDPLSASATAGGNDGSAPSPVSFPASPASESGTPMSYSPNGIAGPLPSSEAATPTS